MTGFAQGGIVQPDSNWLPASLLDGGCMIPATVARRLTTDVLERINCGDLAPSTDHGDVD